MKKLRKTIIMFIFTIIIILATSGYASFASQADSADKYISKVPFSEEFEKYSINKEGLELVLNDDKVSIKVNLSKKIPLISMDNFY